MVYHINVMCSKPGASCEQLAHGRDAARSSAPNPGQDLEISRHCGASYTGASTTNTVNST